MISKNTIKLIHSLSQKKYRKKENLFLVEGDKNVTDALRSKIKVVHLLATKTFLNEQKTTAAKAIKITEVDEKEIKKASLLSTPQNCIALCEIPAQKKLPLKLEKNISLYLDGIQDPGNLGTILRISDWFGVEYVFCSPDTADIYNPKVVQASMGSICRANIVYSPFENISDLARVSNAEITGAFLDGKNIYEEAFAEKIMLVVGNEGNGIRKDVEARIGKKVMIPHFADTKDKAESLNVAVATGIICAEFRRRHSR
ncbi:MAG: RNA methyltransferase [Prolixibacteraceae bacterium]|nr:RNA methyltransferase [Prolixibacteraceae bacterium]